MRRRRQVLQVSTFPFLAVLLCAMGSLILLLLVIDQRAKAVARAKALQAAARAMGEDARAAAARQAELERRRQALHALLVQQDEILRTQIKTVADKTQSQAANFRIEKVRYLDLDKKLQSEKTRLSQGIAELTVRRCAAATQAQQTKSANKELLQLTEELHLLEQTLKDLQMLRQRDPQTYSLVPYKGRRGENRRPIYIECTGNGVIFHPDQHAQLTMRGARSEVERQIGRQGRTLPAVGTKSAERPYLLLLVRPDGIGTYYKTLEALEGIPFDFGYEFVEQDWVLDFSTPEDQAGKQPWMIAGPAKKQLPQPPAAIKRPLSSTLVAGRSGSGTLRAGIDDPGTGPDQSGPGLRGTSPGGTSGGGNRGGPAGGSSLGTLQANAGPLSLPSSAAPGAASSGTNAPGGTAVGPASRAGPGEAVSGNLPANAGSASPGVASPAKVQGVVLGTGPSLEKPTDLMEASMAEGPPVSGGQGNASRGNQPFSTLPSWVPGKEGGGSAHPSDRLIQGGSLLGESEEPATAVQGGKPGDSPGNAAGKPSKIRTAIATVNTSGQSPSSASATGGANRSGPSSNGGEPSSHGTPGTSASDGSSAQASGNSEPGPPRNSFTQLLNQVPSRTPVRQQAPLFRVVASRDWIIPVECTADAIVLRTARVRFPTSALANKTSAPHPLVQAVRQMIDQRQATVPAGEAPYRPMIRLQVRPDGQYAYYLIYPLLETLHLPMARQDLEAEDKE